MTGKELYRFTVELTFLDKLGNCKWWEFRKKRAAYRWREEKLLRYKY